MRNTWRLAVVIFAALLGAIGFGVARSAPHGARSTPKPPSPVGKLVVHEWGTFTNFAGADGIQLELRPLVDQELPRFVYESAGYSDQRFEQLLGKSRLTARQRMETPVTYFYVDRPTDVEVRVGFPQGLLTEFYPPVKTALPAFHLGERPPLENSRLDWGRVRLLPQASFEKHRHRDSRGRMQPAALPEVAGDNHYAFARETDSAVVEVTDQGQYKHYEKFLFYRGLGDFTLPLQFTALDQRRFSVQNDGPEAVKSLFLVHIERDRVRFRHAPFVAAHGALVLDEPETDSSIEQLGNEMVQELEQAGLYEKEARAMVKPWRSSWFGEPGTRLLYLVPGNVTNKLLPLDIKPTPDELVRVLVGRMELLAPTESERLQRIIRESGSCLAIDNEPLRGELARLGRFAEPALEYLSQRADNEQERAAIKRLLSELRASGANAPIGKG